MLYLKLIFLEAFRKERNLYIIYCISFTSTIQYFFPEAEDELNLRK